MKKNPTDSTTRNTQAANKKIAKLREDIKALKAEMKTEIRRIKQRLDDYGIY